jgi:hypothetical protein
VPPFFSTFVGHLGVEVAADLQRVATDAPCPGVYEHAHAFFYPRRFDEGHVRRHAGHPERRPCKRRYCLQTRGLRHGKDAVLGVRAIARHVRHACDFIARGELPDPRADGIDRAGAVSTKRARQADVENLLQETGSEFPVDRIDARGGDAHADFSRARIGQRALFQPRRLAVGVQPPGAHQCSSGSQVASGG